MRVYRPTTLADLRRQVPGGVLSGPEGFVAGSDDETAEYLALMSAADVSAALPDAGGRRVVVVAELDDGADPDAPVRMRSVVAVHADPTAGAGPDDDLAWYATQEIGQLLAR